MAKIDIAKLDRRVAERMIRNGQLSQEEWEKHLSELADLSEEAEPFTAELQVGVLEKRQDAE